MQRFWIVSESFFLTSRHLQEVDKSNSGQYLYEQVSEVVKSGEYMTNEEFEKDRETLIFCNEVMKLRLNS